MNITETIYLRTADGAVICVEFVSPTNEDGRKKN
jgi:hypothetical protein